MMEHDKAEALEQYISIAQYLSFLMGNAFGCVWCAGRTKSKDRALEYLEKARRYLFARLSYSPSFCTGRAAIRMFERNVEDNGSLPYKTLQAIVRDAPESAIAYIADWKLELMAGHTRCCLSLKLKEETK